MMIQKSETSKWPCPIGRTFADPIKTCIGDRCPIWRNTPVRADHPANIAAIRKLQSEGLSHKDAVAKALAKRDEYGIPKEPFEGFCGLGGQSGPVVL